MKDRNGLEIGPEKPCSICGTPVATRPDGSVRHHSRWRSSLHPGLGVDACPGGKNPYDRRCTFCHAPAGEPCRTRLYEEHVEHGNGEVHTEPHAARLVDEPFVPSPDCPACYAKGAVTYTREEQSFPYGLAPNTVTLSATVEVGRCDACKLEFTDWRAEDARDEAVQRHLHGTH